MRYGYQSNFLDGFEISLPEPNLNLMGDVLSIASADSANYVIPYIHYSLAMSRSTKQAIFSAANVDNNSQKVVSGKKGRKWFIDDRVGKENQVTNDAYTHSPWDRGHLTRRTAVTWGTEEIALQASNDSCAYTNASMQHENFNEDEWRVPEKAVADFGLAKDKKLIVMTGPVFTTCDRYFSKTVGFEPVRIPAGFWKTITYLDSGSQLVTAAYLFFQDIDSLRTRTGKKRIKLRSFRITTTELQLWTGLKFDHQMFVSNPLKFFDGPEAIRVKEFKELTSRQKALLAAGIVEGTDYQAIREVMKVSELEELIEELCWY